jgi:signal transduction histidine kinase
MYITENSLILAMIIAVVLVGGIIAYLLHAGYMVYQAQLSRIRQRDETIITTAEKERQLIALDLHDDLSPILTATRFKLESMATLNGREQQLQEQAIHLIEGVVTRIRQWAYQLSPVTVLNTNPFCELETFAQGLQSMQKINFHIHPFPNIQFTGERSMHVHRMLQEIIHNAFKHSKANHMRIYGTVQHDTKLLIIAAIDDGIGFNVAQTERGTKGTGLQNLRTRARLLNAALAVESEPGSGCMYTIKIPL